MTRATAELPENAEQTGISTRQYLEHIIDERERLSDMRHNGSQIERAHLVAAGNNALAAFERQVEVRFSASDQDRTRVEQAIYAALAAMDKQTAFAFAASEKAITKAEDAQESYNIRSNEFRGQLADQATMLMPRSESAAIIKGLEDKVYAIKSEMESKLEGLRTAVDKDSEGTTKEIQTLRESKSNMDGRMIILGIGGAAIVAIIVSLLSAGILSVVRSSGLPTTPTYPNPYVQAAPPQQAPLYVPAQPGTILPQSPAVVVTPAR